MKKLKLNEPMAKKFFEGFFGGIYKRDVIESLLGVMNENKAAELEITQGFYDKQTMDYDENDVEIVITCKLRKIDKG
jgi:hypothetical protein